MSRAHTETLEPLVEEIGISPEEIAQRKSWLQFTDKDIELLTSLNKVAQGYADDVIEELYKHFMSFEQTRSFFRDPEVLNRVKNLQKEYFRRLTQGNYGREYVENRLKIGQVHQRIGLDFKWYLGAYNLYIRIVASRISETYKNDPAKAQATLFSLHKLIHFDIGLAIDTYMHTIRKQQEAIRELSTPVLQLRQGLLILPIIGIIDSQRARQLTEGLLRAIRDSRAKVVVMDITGVAAVDSRVASHLIQTVEAARLMGARVVVTGLSPEVAQTLVTIGVDLSKITTMGDLQGGIDEADRLLGYQVKASENSSPNRKGAG